jgi:hypothetical protein
LLSQLLVADLSLLLHRGETHGHAAGPVAMWAQAIDVLKTSQAHTLGTLIGRVHITH